MNAFIRDSQTLGQGKTQEAYDYNVSIAKAIKGFTERHYGKVSAEPVTFNGQEIRGVVSILNMPDSSLISTQNMGPVDFMKCIVSLVHMMTGDHEIPVEFVSLELMRIAEGILRERME